MEFDYDISKNLIEESKCERVWVNVMRVMMPFFVLGQIIFTICYLAIPLYVMCTTLEDDKLLTIVMVEAVLIVTITGWLIATTIVLRALRCGHNLYSRKDKSNNV